MGPTPGSSAATDAARRLIDAHEANLDSTTRKARGIHYTPHDLAATLARRAIDLVEARLGRLPATVCDPSCGSGAFLVAAAEELVTRGLDPIDVVTNRLVGYDIDEQAVDVAKDALIVWLSTHTDEDPLRHADPDMTLDINARDVLDATDDVSLGEHDLVIGNPPFLTQLRSSTALGPQRLAALSDRLGELDPYVDASALFLDIATRSVTTGGVVCLLQPQSFLCNASARTVRDRVARSGGPIEVWSAQSTPFNASVRVCAISTGPFDRGNSGDDQVVVVWSGGRGTVEPTDVYRVDRPRVGESWGYMIAPAVGIPDLPMRLANHHDGRTDSGIARTIGELARTTAGFRDEYYALRDACTEDSPALQEPRDSGDGTLHVSPARVVTTGLIRPGGCDWGSVPARIGGTQWDRPVVRPEAVDRMKDRVRSWVVARMVPKVLVATQSRVVEACADPEGTMVPMTPVISIEPFDGWERLVDPHDEHDVDIWWIVAALSAPSVSVVALTTHLGSGLSPHSLRWSASAVRDVDLPSDHDSWASGAHVAAQLASCPPQDRDAHLEALGRHMLDAHDLTDRDDMFEWWYELARRA